jgi:hypothetical protein
VKNSYSLGFLYFFEGKKNGGTVGSRNSPRVSVRTEWIFFFTEDLNGFILKH